MNKFLILSVVSVLGLFGACQKQQTEAERNAEIERQVNERLAAERQAAEQQRLAQRQDELDVRVKALSEQERSAATTAPEPQRAPDRSAGDVSEASPGPSYSMFYTKLEPLGAWRETSTYGYVWQPREAVESRSWRPYTNGHWVYTDAGWTWISEEPFGWAAYHYGRWTRLRGIGWVWVPGDEWAPAWVSWRTSNDYVGWAPLPPEARFEHRTGIQNWADSYYDIGPEQYCFVPTREIGSQRIERVVVPREQNVTIVNQTTNVTNITYNNTTIVNQGPNYEEVRARSQQPVARLRLERRTTVNFEAENPRPVVRGEVVEMAAPVIARVQMVDRPPAVKEKMTETVVENGWEGIADNQAAQKARAKIKSEATPPPNAPPRTFVKPAPVAAQPRATSRPERAIATPTVRSTITPQPRVAATSAAQTPSATRFAQPARTPGTKPMQTAAPVVTASPRFTPFQRAQPTMTPAATATARAVETMSATPFPTLSATPRPTFSPLSAPPLSAAPAFTSTPAPPAFGRSAEKKAERTAKKDLRKQEAAEKKNDRSETTASTAAPTATPSSSVSPAGAPTEARGKQHKKKNRPGEPETSPPTANAASPTATPQ